MDGGGRGDDISDTERDDHSIVEGEDDDAEHLLLPSSVSSRRHHPFLDRGANSSSTTSDFPHTTIAMMFKSVITLANSIIGVSILAMPFCFKQCGIFLAILLLVMSGIVVRICCHLLIKSAMIARRRNYELLGEIRV
jgi:hypothetical protein